MTFMINDGEIKIVSEIGFRGVIFDELLSWKKHIHCRKSKISKSISVLYKFKYLLPHMICYMIWGNILN